MVKNSKNVKLESKKTETKKDTPKIVSKAEKKTAVKPDKKQSKPTIVGKGHLVSVEYVGTLDNGEEFDNSKNHGPIKFVAGGAQVIKGFDDAVLGMKVNDKKKFKINKENAYGDINPELLHKVPLAKLPPELKAKVKIGGFLVLQSPVGQQMPAKVVALDKENVTLDLNHPLAGKNLTFDIKIVDIDIAPEQHEHVHGDNCDHDSCGPGCNC